ncbi:hypothetical protein AVEN_60867-1 [Araneus ventricosus]|uniref:Uncharacterized protein n=1 Tax=Araneus ventricosus TaxID=182803 RepID=A0A4Y2INM7_ARAVE|nr:hypothetical protein AVEN_60867-1 [Araneus ventricosus]
MSLFEAIRGLFWTGLLAFKLRSDDVDDTRDGIPSVNFHTTSAGELSTLTDLKCIRSAYVVYFRWNQVSNTQPPLRSLDSDTAALFKW